MPAPRASVSRPGRHPVRAGNGTRAPGGCRRRSARPPRSPDPAARFVRQNVSIRSRSSASSGRRQARSANRSMLAQAQRFCSAAGQGRPVAAREERRRQQCERREVHRREVQLLDLVGRRVSAPARSPRSRQRLAPPENATARPEAVGEAGRLPCLPRAAGSAYRPGAAEPASARRPAKTRAGRRRCCCTRPASAPGAPCAGCRRVRAGSTARSWAKPVAPSRIASVSVAAADFIGGCSPGHSATIPRVAGRGRNTRSSVNSRWSIFPNPISTPRSRSSKRRWSSRMSTRRSRISARPAATSAVMSSILVLMSSILVLTSSILVLTSSTRTLTPASPELICAEIIVNPPSMRVARMAGAT